MASIRKRPDSEDVEMTYNWHLKDIQRGDSVENRSSGGNETDEREIRRMGKFSQYKVR